jgi:microcin C transport system substrate-binding protein
MKKGCIPLLLLAAITVGAQQQFPPDGWKDTADPIASPAAYPGGSITLFAGQYPQSFNYYLDNNVLSAQLFSSMYESLLGIHPLTAEYVPGLADRWTISEDKKTFTFHLDPAAKWSDGAPITADDILWTFKAILDTNNLTGVHKVSLENFLPPEKLDERTVRFTARDVHWRNLGAIGGFNILPKHAFADRDFNKINFEFPVVSGPYHIDNVNEGIFITLKRRPDWWGFTRESNRGTYNFDTIKYRFFADRANGFEAFKKGQIDVFPVYTSRLWVNETGSERFTKNHIVKQRVTNKKPIGFQGFAMNMRRPPFDDLRVRKAMAHLLDREKMNRTLMYNQYFLHKSYYEDLYTEDTPCTNPVFKFDKEKARQLLAEAGWKANPETGILEKDERPFHFKFLTRDPSSDKFLAIYAEDLKDVGIALEIERKDWAAWTRDMGEFNFDMTWAAWGAGLFKDPEGMWESDEARRRNGNNITGFANQDVDRLIEKQKTLFDVQKRNEICREIDRLVAAEVPYVLLWNIDAVRLLYWNRFGTPASVLSKFGNETSALTYWWYDEDSAADLRDVMETGSALPKRPAEVNWTD